MAKEDGYKNLIPFNQRSEEDQRRIRSMGGKKGSKVRAEKRTMKELLTLAFSMKIKNGATGEEVTRKEATTRVIVDKCVRGDLKAIELASKLIGEYKESMEVTGKDGKDLISAKSVEEKMAELNGLMNKLNGAD